MQSRSLERASRTLHSGSSKALLLSNITVNKGLLFFVACSIEGRNETFFRDWPPKPVENDGEIVQRDPRLFPIRTPQPPRRPQLYNSQYFLDETPGDFQVQSSYLRV